MMPYDEKETKLQINAMKQRGLFKLKYYCQMCRKQCSDDNGFKCHTSSDSHLRSMRLYSEEPEYFTRLFSKEFEEEFIGLLKLKYQTKPVHPNNVYIELIKQREHIHMNGTQWATLKDFISSMVKKNIIVLHESEKQVYIQLIDNSAQAVKKRKEEEKRQVHLQNQAQQANDFVLQQVERGKWIEAQQKNLQESQVDKVEEQFIPDKKFEFNLQLNIEPQKCTIKKPLKQQAQAKSNTKY